MNEKLINVKGITFSYGRKKANVFEDFSMSLNRGAVYGLLGKNGTGKSTLLYLMCGLLRPKAGQVLMNGIDVKLRLPQTLRDTFLVPEEFSFPNLPLKQFVKLNAPFYPNFSDEILRRCLADFDMDTDIHLNELSMGQKKKAYMCFALATNTPLLIMDEPTNHLDIKYQLQLMELVRGSGCTVVAAIHDLNLAAAYCHRLYALKDGVIVGEGAPKELLTPAFLREVYEVEAEVLTGRDGSLRVFFYPSRIS